MKIPTFYSEKQIADIGVHDSPSSMKPKQVAEALVSSGFSVEIIEPTPVTVEDFKLVHKPEFVDDILACRVDNGFSNRSTAVAASLPYTTGAMLSAARAAIGNGKCAAALVSGFHHAKYDRPEGFCTFNGLVVTAKKLVDEGHKVAIIDADQHYGDGTDEMLGRLCIGPSRFFFHFTFGKYFHRPYHAVAYLDTFNGVRRGLEEFKPTVILYQAGADAHRDDPYGGVLSTDELYTRDLTMFKIAKDLNVPIAWDLAGGYQRDATGGIPVVLEIHLNTFKAANEVFNAS